MQTTQRDLAWTIGDRMRKARDVAGISQTEMAALLTARGFKCSGSTTVSSWEGGKQPRRFMDVMQAWADITEVDRDWLLTGVFPGGSRDQNWKFLNLPDRTERTFRLTPAA